ncbi:putative protein [Arabidopsis thaliana]|uniref:3-oxo-5-alpha-steroid 4-dehydrogenase family protein n=1 Tax=Arabidopsis thaliana TaxID=3702 RepID=Q9LZG4_ARATH|nr:3-oxo-5-alpha-steroid 4-dehydrogenase family protein [Arabidopsis thaliana]NP_189970.1 3-oxo-5-alpha-steroid 4-dehydrogenase family protein [Arabidopsis thaliana]AEE77834.1 3-oxo-5-alpha-steroid 4-dehydrogenase family protein [Arabidopsis thaliana]ANM65952.1 3-oxo-5-alpha-steroid 4-dehydrogenase family protein [Arabidopsis thaliana]CAB83156.1 putative protein [Arabidopsis thaliana]|eukprot:NP_001319677.1 3-oxo-5-alpha-steroid 4-dehydrogenase family protein [Arabidopsis thaliana]
MSVLMMMVMAVVSETNCVVKFVTLPNFLSAFKYEVKKSANLPIWLLFGFVAANLTYAAGETHRWYLAKFENYPANRHAIFPYVY